MKLLKEKRIEKGFTLLSLARNVGVSLKTIYNYESGAREPSIAMLIRLAEVLDCTIDDLIDKVGDNNNDK